MVPRPITETVTVCETTMIPQSSTVNVQVMKCRPVTETVTRQTSVCVPYQVPVTVMTTQMRPIVGPGARGPECSGVVPVGSDPARWALSFSMRQVSQAACFTSEKPGEKRP